MNPAYVACHSVARKARLAGVRSQTKYRTEGHRNEMRPVSDAENGGSMFLQNFGTYLPNATASHPRMSQYCLNTHRTWNFFQILFLCFVLNHSILRLCHKKNRNCFQTVKRDTMFCVNQTVRPFNCLTVLWVKHFPNLNQTFVQNVTSIFKRT